MTRTTHEYVGTLNIVECAACHMDFGMLPRFQSDRRRDHMSFYCPAGHLNYYSQKSDIEQARDKAEREAARAANLTARLDQEQAARQRAQRRVIAMKGVVTRTKKRIAAGKCVRCSEEFPNLATHMAEEHPGFDPEGP